MHPFLILDTAYSECEVEDLSVAHSLMSILMSHSFIREHIAATFSQFAFNSVLNCANICSRSLNGIDSMTTFRRPLNNMPYMLPNNANRFSNDLILYCFWANKNYFLEIFANAVHRAFVLYAMLCSNEVWKLQFWNLEPEPTLPPDCGVILLTTKVSCDTSVEYPYDSYD